MLIATSEGLPEYRKWFDFRLFCFLPGSISSPGLKGIHLFRFERRLASKNRARLSVAVSHVVIVYGCVEGDSSWSIGPVVRRNSGP